MDDQVKLKVCDHPDSAYVPGVSMREYVDLSFSRERELRESQTRATNDALALARVSIEQRLEGMNELREQINRERGTYVNRELFDRLMNTLESRVRSVEDFKSNMDGRLMAIGGIMILIQIIIAAVSLFWHPGGAFVKP